MILAIAATTDRARLIELIEEARRRLPGWRICILDARPHWFGDLEVTVVRRRPGQGPIDFQRELRSLAIDSLLVPIDGPWPLWPRVRALLLYPASEAMLTLEPAHWVPWKPRYLAMAVRLLVAKLRERSRPPRTSERRWMWR